MLELVGQDKAVKNDGKKKAQLISNSSRSHIAVSVANTKKFIGR